MAKVTVKSEIKRLKAIYQVLPANEFAVAQGLIEQAARLRVKLDELHADLEANGMVELFTQSDKTEPYERERPQARLYIAMDKNYQAIIKQLLELVPPAQKASRLQELMNG